jgi:flagellar protein FliO/FliZ
MMVRFRLTWLALMLVPLAAPAAEVQGATPAVASSLSFGGMFQVLFALLAVLAAIVGTAWLLKRFGPTQLGPGGAMKVLGGVAVGPRERLVLVEVGDTWLIVGVAQGQVSAIHTMTRPADSAQRSEGTSATSPFAERLKQMLGPKQG